MSRDNLYAEIGRIMGEAGMTGSIDIVLYEGGHEGLVYLYTHEGRQRTLKTCGRGGLEVARIAEHMGHLQKRHAWVETREDDEDVNEQTLHLDPTYEVPATMEVKQDIPPSIKINRKKAST